MNLKRMLGTGAALALAGAGLLVTGGAAQAAEIPLNDGRIMGPLVASRTSANPEATLAGGGVSRYWLTDTGALATSVHNGGTTEGSPWVRDFAHPAWAEAAEGAVIVSLPAPGGYGHVRVESGQFAGKCLQLHVYTTPEVRLSDCSSSNGSWSLMKRDDGAYILHHGGQAWNDPIVAWSVGTNQSAADGFNIDLYKPSYRTVADPTAEVVGDVIGGVANIQGTGEPGGKITLTGPDGTKYTADVDGNGKWGPVEVPGFPEGTTTVPVTQTVDGQAAGETSVDVTVPHTGAPLVVVDDEENVIAGEPKTIDVLANDTGDGLTIDSIVSGPSHGTVEIVDNKIVYTAEEDYQGPDLIQIKVVDEYGNEAVSYLTICVHERAEVPLMAPAFAFGGLALAGASVGGRALKKRRTNA